MKLQYEGVESIRAPIEVVRRFLLDPERLGRCLPDLQELRPETERSFLATVRVGVGAVRGLFRLTASIREEEGQRVAVLLKGTGLGSGLQVESRVALRSVGEGTELAWQADATVSGPLAGVGGRLLESQARKTIEQLFTQIRQQLETVGV